MERTIYTQVRVSLCKCVGKGWGVGGLKPLQILSSCYYVYKQLPQKDIQNVGKQKREKQLSGYKQCYTYKIKT